MVPNKAQALNQFWNGFGLPAYEESVVPDNAQMPYITYNVSTGKMDDMLLPSASLWYRSTSWKDIELKALEIAEAIGKHGYYIQKIDGGYIVVRQGTPFSQRMSDENPDVRRIYLNIAVEYLTAW